MSRSAYSISAFLVSLAVFLSLPPIMDSESADPEGFPLELSREEAIRTALQDNPGLSVAALEIERARSRLRWAGRLPNPELELSGSTDRFGRNEDEAVLEIAFSQRFPVTSRLRDEKAVGEHDVELAEIEFRSRRRHLAYQVDKAALTLQAAERRERLRNDLLELNQEIVGFTTESARRGEVSRLDVTQATLNGRLLEQELASTKAATTLARSRLLQLLGASPDRFVTLSDSLVLPESAPAASLDLDTVLRHRPDYAAVLVSRQRGEARLGLAMSRRWSDVAVKVFAEREHAQDAPFGLERNTFAGIGLSIPLPFRNRNQQAIEEAEIDIEKARRALDAKVFAISSEIRSALKARLAAYRLAESAGGDALELAKQNFEEFKAAQQVGQASLLQVQQAQTQLLQLESAALEFQNDYHLAEIELRFVAGTYPLPPANAYLNSDFDPTLK